MRLKIEKRRIKTHEIIIQMILCSAIVGLALAWREADGFIHGVGFALAAYMLAGYGKRLHKRVQGGEE